MSAAYPPVQWPGDKRFAFTIFDDPDSQTLEAGREVYALLHDLGFRTTKAIWPLAPTGTPSDHGTTCGDPATRDWCRELLDRGFELALHNATSHTSPREVTRRALEAYAGICSGRSPQSMANHYYCSENIYWGDKRVTGYRRTIYNLVTAGKNKGRFHGDEEGHPLFWGDLCREHIRYVRNFVFANVNTLAECPFMPYHDPMRPFVNHWFASSEGSNVDAFTRTLTAANQDRLEEEGGACILYTHFGHGFFVDGRLDRRFVDSMTALRERNGWFVPVATLLDFLRSSRGPHVLSDEERRSLELRWLWHKLRFGTA